MKQIKQKQITGHELIDAKLIAGLNLTENAPHSIASDIILLSENDVDKATTILCKHFDYKPLVFAENIFVPKEFGLPLVLKPYDNYTTTCILDYLENPVSPYRYEDYYGALYREWSIKESNTIHKLNKELVNLVFLIPFVITASVFLIGFLNLVLVITILTYGLVTQHRKLKPLAELDLKTLNKYARKFYQQQ